MSKIACGLIDNIDSAFSKVGLTTEHAAHLKEIGHLKILSKKELLICEGTTCNFIGIVINGTLRAFVTNQKEEFNTDFFFEGDYVTALTSFLTHQPTSLNIEALTDSTILMLSLEQYDELLRGDARWALLGKFITETSFVRKCRREISFLRQSAAKRLETLCISYPGIEQKVSQYHIASYLGIRPESLSRIKLTSAINKS